MELMAVQDLFMAPLLAIPTAITEILYKHSGWALIHVLGAYGIATAAAVLLSRRMLPRVLSALSSGAPEIFGLGVVSYAMAMSLLADRFSLSHEAGALFAGLVLIGTPHVKQAAAAVKPLTSLFGGMYVFDDVSHCIVAHLSHCMIWRFLSRARYLASLGLIMSPTFIAEHLPTIGAHVACVFGLKLGVVGLTMRVLGFSWAAALAAGATLAQISEVSLFMVARAQQLGLLSRGAYLMILATTVVLLAFGPLAVCSCLIQRIHDDEYSNSYRHSLIKHIIS